MTSSVDSMATTAAATAKKMMRVVFVLGPPGSGKGTQCSKISDRFKFIHLSAGDLLREEQNRQGSQFGELINMHIVNGTIVPVEITCKLLENAMIEHGGGDAPGFLVDGFPRNKDNLDGWCREMGKKTEVAFVLFIKCDPDICVQRCLKRGAASNRADDNEASLKKRIQTYTTQTMPIIDHYANMSLVRTVDGAGTTETTFEQIKNIFVEEKCGEGL